MPPKLSKKQLKSTGRWSIFGGILALLLGFGWLFEYNRHGYINTARHDFVPTYGGTAGFICYLAFLTGVIFIIFGINNLIKSKHTHAKTPENYICPKCQTVWPATEIVDTFCLKCKLDLENLDGFYDHHPDLK